MFFLLTILFFITAFIIENHLIYQKKKIIMKELENAFLLAGVSHEQYRHQIMGMLEIVYEKAAETDEQYKKDYENIRKKADEKFTQFCNDYIVKLKNVLGYETSYNNWQEATKYIERQIQESKRGNEKRMCDDDRE